MRILTLNTCFLHRYDYYFCLVYWKFHWLTFSLFRSDKLSPGAYLARPNRPPPSDEVRTYRRPRYRTFPEEVDRIPLVKADCSIPPLSEVPGPEVICNLWRHVVRSLMYDVTLSVRDLWRHVVTNIAVILGINFDFASLLVKTTNMT